LPLLQYTPYGRKLDGICVGSEDGNDVIESTPDLPIHRPDPDMSLTVKEFRRKDESVNQQRLPALSRFQGKRWVGSEPVFHHLINLAPPAFKTI